MLRREFLTWFLGISGGYVAVSTSPLTRINTTLFGEAHAQVPCTQDTCTSNAPGSTCEESDVCESDSSGHCRNDECNSDSSGTCNGDRCVSDSSGDCTNDGGPATGCSTCDGDTCTECDADTGCTLCDSDTCTACDADTCGDDTSGYCVSDESGPCTNDSCVSDSSKGCQNDTCRSDSSGDCNSDKCRSDSSGECTGGDTCVSDSSGICQSDKCVADSSGICEGDSCVSDSSGDCRSDACVSDKSGGCTTDKCVSDKSGDCTGDTCVSDSSKECSGDTCRSDSSGECSSSDSCVSDSSGSCVNDVCIADSSGDCSSSDSCVSDSSGPCVNDTCIADSSGDCGSDRCRSDNSGTCERDVCILDFSSSCGRDLCREDRSPSDCTNDTCSLDLALNHNFSRRNLAKAGINQAIKWLYKLSIMILFIASAHGAAHAATVIDATNAVFLPTPTYMTSQAVSVPSPVGPFLRDCDGDGILEADTNGDGQCAGDPEVKDYNGDGSRELPPGTPFAGSFQFTCFHIPSDVAIVATGPLSINASQEVAIFGAMKLSFGAEISSPVIIDLRTSAWLSEEGNITFITALPGEVDETQPGFETDTVPPIAYNSVCTQQQQQPAVAVPTMTGWGLIILLALTGAGAVYRLRRVGFGC